MRYIYCVLQENHKVLRKKSQQHIFLGTTDKGFVLTCDSHCRPSGKWSVLNCFSKVVWEAVFTIPPVLTIKKLNHQLLLCMCIEQGSGVQYWFHCLDVTCGFIFCQACVQLWAAACPSLGVCCQENSKTDGSTACFRVIFFSPLNPQEPAEEVCCTLLQ